MRGTTLYAAYGANTNIRAMERRCPDAVPVGAARIFGWKLMFRGVADVVPQTGAELWVALWEITPKCERALDHFESYPSLYVKRDFVLTQDDGSQRYGMFYVMNNASGSFVPYVSYQETLREGYGDFDMPIEQINRAIHEAELAESQLPTRMPVTDVKLRYPQLGSAWERRDRKAAKKAPKKGRQGVLIDERGQPLTTTYKWPHMPRRERQEA